MFSGTTAALAQQTTVKETVAPALKSLRYDEDYRYLSDPTKRSDPWDAIKYIPLGFPSWFLSLGGEVRERFESYSAGNFGVPGKTGDSYLLHRVLLHADLHAGDSVRGFVQLGSHLAPGKDLAAPPYFDVSDVQQAFFDIRLPVTGNANIDPDVRIGRQELAFGAQRLVSIRDAPNVRRAFDGFRIGGSIADVRLDAFVTRPVLLHAGAFDDYSSPSQAFWGLYTTVPKGVIPNSGLDLYYLGFENRNALFSAGAGVEQRHAIGARVFGGAAPWDWDWEALGQFGSFGQQEIRAWGFSTDTGYTSAVGSWKARSGFKATVGSGDSNPQDGKLGTYGGFFPKLAYFNQAGLIGASNVADLQPSLTLRPTDQLKITMACDFIWRQTIKDAVYTSVGIPIAGTAGVPGQYSSTQYSIDLFWQADRHVSINAGYVYVDVSRSLLKVGGHNSSFSYISAAYSF
ncbi:MULTISPECIES: alginate export family protein [unclassified Bradyrhizobium]|uniref:alginate export family protein n=1 Tax=unclassified Bradyrhizobium TaxID=2631580 RepID=UPI002478A908|nr:MULTISPECIES: alginate export family protein [unclassified Bradyrhizobium]WGR73111.1 alginate export family protein [Bradyrhizobium sp. ISRA426]WGR77951.1 alginate export family protein [Bradyrhizobium sp. ISRA430]WGR88352.1 alginate export family protein [Bradyrhizobium sp. ISRA432]